MLTGELVSKPTQGEALRVLHVITGLGDGGAEGALYRLCKFDSSDQHVVVSLMDSGKHAEPLERLGVAVHRLGMARGRFSLRAALRLWRLMRSYRPDVVQTWLYHADLIGGLVARLAGVPQVVWGIRHSDLQPGKVKMSTIAIARLSARLSRFVPRKIACCSHVAKRVHVELGYDRRKFWVIPNGYDLAALAPDEAVGRSFRSELGIADNMPLLGMVSRFDPQKDHANLLSALAQLVADGAAFRCALVGTGMSEDNPLLMEQVHERALEEHMLLLGRRDDIGAVMNGLDLHVLSSLSEAFPNVLAEAMACGTPCVSTDVGDAALIVGDSGWIVSPGDPAALVEALRSALASWRDPAAWRLQQEAARARIVEHFNINAVVEAYRSCWSAPDPVAVRMKSSKPPDASQESSR